MLPRFFAPYAMSKCIAALVCSSLLIGALTPLGLANGGRRSFLKGRTQEGSLSPVAGAPEGYLPNLDEVRNGQLPQPAAPPSVPSTMRSVHSPLEPRAVRHVGDPLPSPLPSPSILPSPSPLPSPSISPVSSPLPSPSPSILPSPPPLPSPSTSPLLLPLTESGKTTTAEPWIRNHDANEDLLPYLLAWTHSYRLPYQSDYSLFDLTELERDSPSSQWPSDGRYSSNAAFDFFLLPMPQAGNSRIVFATNRDGQAQLYSMDTNGGNLVRLTNNGSNDDHPRWSTNGVKILFQSDRDNPETGNQDIYLMNADGTGQTRLTTDAADDCNAVWSPDGTKIVFQKSAKWDVLPSLRNEF